MELAMDLNIFDVEIPTKTVVLGIKTTLNQGNATNLTAMTGGCAMLLKQTLIFLLLDGVVTMCTSGGGQGKYDPKLPGYVSDITLSGELKAGAGSWGEATFTITLEIAIDLNKVLQYHYVLRCMTLSTMAVSR
mmetsp:Transcript_22286/g.21967  ORF Transcript_22286/g.21967 Transcript_22286/m.21967 type:complete len:133 (+) Transcript_22286:223-621(+)